MKNYSQYHKQALRLLNKDSFYDDLYSLFCKELILYDNTCRNLVQDFGTRYFLNDNRLKREDAVEMSTNFFALVTSNFSDGMDFTGEQWDFIRDTTLSYQNALSIEMLNSILDVLMARKKLVF